MEEDALHKQQWSTKRVSLKKLTGGNNASV